MRDRNLIKGTGEMTLDYCIELFWNQRKYRLTVPLTKESNVGTFQSVPGYKKYSTYCQEAEISPDVEDINPIINQEIEISTTSEIQVPESTKDPVGHWTHDVQREQGIESFSNSNEKLQIPIPLFEESTENLKLEEKLMEYHRDFGHLSFTKL